MSALWVAGQPEARQKAALLEPGRDLRLDVDVACRSAGWTGPCAKWLCVAHAWRYRRSMNCALTMRMLGLSSRVSGICVRA
jgi:hypothetical protein